MQNILFIIIMNVLASPWVKDNLTEGEQQNPYKLIIPESLKNDESQQQFYLQSTRKLDYPFAAEEVTICYIPLTAFKIQKPFT